MSDLVAGSAYPAVYVTGFEDDVFGLRPTGLALSGALERASQPLVIAVDGDWGSGKSWFLKAWSGEHLLEDAAVVYFDAFERDYLDDPLVSLLAAIHARTLKGMLAESAASREWIGQLTDAALLLADGQAAGLLGGLRKVAGKGKAEVPHGWDGVMAREAAMARFRAALGEIVGLEGGPQKLVVIVDELDRCRPDYALRMLEVMKHFFNVAGVHFVLGVNMAQLAHSVRAVYGEGFDGERYLQRFVPVVMEFGGVSNPATRQRVANYLQQLAPVTGNERLAWVLTHLPDERTFTFRDAERLHTLGQVTQMTGTELENDVQAALMVLRIARPKLYEQLQSGETDGRDVLSFLAGASWGQRVRDDRMAWIVLPLIAKFDLMEEVRWANNFDWRSGVVRVQMILDRIGTFQV